MNETSQPEPMNEIAAAAAALGVRLPSVQMEMLLPQAQAAAKAMCEVDGLDLTEFPPADVYLPGGE